jgi:4-amino-4-deoxy-L-arabinose transferase-like glycosyltransferase
VALLEGGAHARLQDRQRSGLDMLLRLAEPWLPPDEPDETPPQLDWRSGRWPLIVVLCVQAVLSARLIWANTAFQDEGLYLWAGHLELSHLFNGTKIPAFGTYFSGAPVIYPPIAAFADSAGGLAAARLLSLLFMLGATALLWGMTARLFGRRSAVLAAALFALLGPTQLLGSLATYDAMALFLMALAAWCAVRGRYNEDSAGWMFLSGTALLLANITTYATILYDPVVIVLAIMAARPAPGMRRALTRGGMILVHVTVAIVVLAAATGSEYRIGLSGTTLSRAQGVNSVLSVLMSTAQWIGLLTALALVGVMLSYFGRSRFLGRPTVPVLAAAVLLAPIEQARIHTLVSLDKHLDLGAWFAAAAAGFALSRLTRSRTRVARAVVAASICALLAVSAYLGATQATVMANWPGSAALIAKLRPLTDNSGRFLAENPSVEEYYLPDTSWRQWSSTTSITTPSGSIQNENGKLASYINAIRIHYFSLIVMDFRNTPDLDARLIHEMRNERHYKLVATVPFGHGVAGDYQIWRWLKHPGTAK